MGLRWSGFTEGCQPVPGPDWAGDTTNFSALFYGASIVLLLLFPLISVISAVLYSAWMHAVVDPMGFVRRSAE